MHLWNTAALADELKRGRVSEKESMKYLLTATFLLLLPPPLAYEFDADWAGHVAMLILGTLSILPTYAINAKGDDKDFIKRYMCLGLPIFLKTLIPFLVSIIAALVVLAPDPLTEAWIITIGSTLYGAFIFYRLYCWMGYTSGSMKQKPGIVF